MAVTESGRRNGDEVGKIRGPTMNREAGLHGHCNDGVKRSIATHGRKIHRTRFATLCPLLPVMLEVAKWSNVI